MIPETGARRCLPQSRRPGDIMKKWMIALLMCGCLIDGFCQSPDISPVSPDIATAPEKAVTDPRAGTSSRQATSGQALYDTRNPDMKTEKTGIAIIAPGGYVSETDYRRGIAGLEAAGYRVFSYYEPDARYQRFAATDAERVRQIEQAAANPDVTIIMAVRGGYGTSRLLHDLDFRKLAASGKLFVGHSDFTVFQMALLKEGGISFAGPMVNSDFARAEISPFMREHFERCLTSPTMTVQWTAQDNPEVDAAGTLWGGNLAMLAHLAGTPWMPDIEGGILFVEDVHEQPYQIERMLLQLDEAGILKKQKALVLGHFSEYRVTDYDNGYDLDAMLAWLRERLAVPVVTGLPFGHVPDKVTLPVGAQAHLVSRDGVVRLDLSGYPTVW